MNDIGDVRRRAIIAELAAMAPRRTMPEPYMFSVGQMQEETGWARAMVERYLQGKVSRGELKCDTNGFNPTTGKRITLYWRPEDEPAT